MTYTSGSITVDGLSGSDTDFKSMIAQLKTLESYQKNRMTLWQADWNRRIEAFQQLNTAMLSLNSTLTSMNTMNKFLLKNATVANSDIMNAIASGDAQNNSNKVEVNKLATNAAYTWEGSKFSNKNDKANPTSQTQDFVYTYKGKTTTVAVGANASMQQFINQINSDANNPGVRASLVKNGSEYVFQIQGQDTGASATLTIDASSSDQLAIKPPTETTTATASKYGSADAVVNNSGSDKNFIYKYNGNNFTVDVPDGGTLEELANSIHNDLNNPGVVASVVQVGNDFVLQIKPEPDDPNIKLALSSTSQIKTAFTTDGNVGGTGWDSMTNKTMRTNSDLRFDSAERTVNSSGSEQTFKWTDSKSNGTPPTPHSITVADGTTLTELAAQINAKAGSSTRAEICKDSKGYYLQLTELTPNHATSPKIDSTSSEFLAITAENTTPNWTTKTDSYTMHSQGFASKDAIINHSDKAQTFKYSFDGKTYEVTLNPNETLNELVNKINTNTGAVDGVVAKDVAQARITCDGESNYKLSLFAVDQDSKKGVTIASDSSSALQIAPPKASWTNNENTGTYGKAFDSTDDIINNSGSPQNFKFIDGSGNLQSITLNDGATLQNLIDEINAVGGGLSATTVAEDGKVKLQISDTNGPVRMESSTSKLLEVGASDNWSSSSANQSISFGNFKDTSAVVNPTGEEQDFVFIYKNKEYSVILAAGATLDNLISQINAHPQAGSLVKASLEEGKFVLKGKDTDPETPNISDASSGALAISRPPSTNFFSKEKSSSTDFTTFAGDKVNKSTTETLKFTYSKGTQTGSIDVPPGCTLEQFISLINNNDKMPGVYASAELIPGTTDQYTLRLSSDDPDQPVVVSPASTRSSDFAIKPPNSSFTEDNDVPVSVYGLPVQGTDIVNTTDKNKTFMVEYLGKNISFDIAPSETVNDLINKINNSDGEIKANLFTDADGNTRFQLWGTNSSDTRPPQVSISSSSDLLIAPPNVGTGGWYVQKNSNGEAKLNDWPEGDEWIEFESNSADELIEGVTLTFKDTGTTQVTVSNNDQGIKEQIVAFVDALNVVRNLINQLTKVDTAKETTDVGDSASNFDAQSGSILTGNYGVQMLSTMLKMTTSSQAPGFQYQNTDADGLIVGDLFTSLAHVGITTVADEKAGNFGLLTIDEEVLDAALAQDSQAVAELFAADNKASVSSSDFSFGSHISGKTEPGAYEFHYTINSDENILEPYVMFKGKQYKASYDKESSQITILEGPGSGMAININNKAQGDYTGTLTLKMGKVGELAALTNELNAENGTLSIMEDNYIEISKNIQKKIDREDDRLDKWERMMKNKFARLEKTLAMYNGLNTQLESTIKGLPSQ